MGEVTIGLGGLKPPSFLRFQCKWLKLASRTLPRPCKSPPPRIKKPPQNLKANFAYECCISLLEKLIEKYALQRVEHKNIIT